MTREMFSRFLVTYAFDTQPECLAAAIGVCFSTKTDSGAMAIREELKRTLKDFMERPPPPMTMELFVEFHDWDEDSSPLKWLTLLKYGLQYLERTQTMDNEKLQLVVGEDAPWYSVTIGSRELDDLIHVASLPCVQLKELHVSMEGVELARVRAFMRELVRVDTIRALSLSLDLNDDGRSFVGAVVSALPSLHSLVSFKLRCLPKSFDTLASRSETAAAHFFQWLAYALIARKRQGLWLSLDLHVSAHTQRQLGDACRGEHPLEALCKGAVHAQHGVIFLPPGSSATLREGTTLATLDDDNILSIQAYGAQRVEVVAQWGETAVVVIPGVGLCSSPVSLLSDWGRRKGRTGVSTHGRAGFLVDALICSEFKSAEVTEALKVFGSSLTTLVVRSCGDTPAQVIPLEFILELCPHLHKLAMIRVEFASFQPLVLAFEQRKCQLNTLIYTPAGHFRIAGAVPRQRVQELANALVAPNHPMANMMRNLVVEYLVLPQDMAELLARGLRSTGRWRFCGCGSLPATLMATTFGASSLRLSWASLCVHTNEACGCCSHSYLYQDVATCCAKSR